MAPKTRSIKAQKAVQDQLVKELDQELLQINQETARANFEAIIEQECEELNLKLSPLSKPILDAV